MMLLIVLLTLFLLHGVVSGPLSRTPLTAPILFTSAGILAALLPAHGGGSEDGLSVLLLVAELGLVLLLFTDGMRTDLRVLRDIRQLPGRLLTVGLLLTLLLGAAAALLVFPGLALLQAGVLAAILAPTDAGLGQVVVSDPRVPLPVRQALNVEAGLNDGISVPFLLFFLAAAEAQRGGEGASLLRLVGEQLGLGTVLGLAIGLLGGRLLRVAHERAWMAHGWEQIGAAMLPLLCATACEELHASMFIAAFVAGLAARSQHAEGAQRSIELAEAWGQLLNLSVFFLFGVLLARAWGSLEPAHLAYALLSLTVVRMLPVAVALWGAKLDRATVLFMGWFGPRGLASIVLALVYIEERGQFADAPTVRLAVMATVALSIYAHGLSARPGIRWLAARSVAPTEPAAPQAR